MKTKKEIKDAMLEIQKILDSIRATNVLSYIVKVTASIPEGESDSVMFDSFNVEDDYIDEFVSQIHYGIRHTEPTTFTDIDDSKKKWECISVMKLGSTDEILSN